MNSGKRDNGKRDISKCFRGEGTLYSLGNGTFHPLGTIFSSGNRTTRPLGFGTSSGKRDTLSWETSLGIRNLGDELGIPLRLF